MRPAVLNPLFASASALKGVGPKLEKALARLLGREGSPSGVRILDLLFHMPTGIVDRRARPRISELPMEGIVTLDVTVGRHHAPPRGSRVPYRVDCSDDTGNLTLVFFHAYAEHLTKLLPVGATRFVSGKIEWYGGTPQIVHPDYVVSEEEFAKLPQIEPVYPLCEGVSARILARAVLGALAKLPALPEWQDINWLSRKAWPGFDSALRGLHAPASPADVSLVSPQRNRLAYDELLANQLALALVRRGIKRAAGRDLSGNGERRKRIIAALPYSLTRSQAHALDEILRDMAAPERMLRLLQGDVGAGKTVVALLSAVAAIESGTQAAFMAPTEILARQHLASLEKLCTAADIRLGLLTGRDKPAARAATLEALAEGRIDLLIGTHALIQDGVAFKDLGLIVIDEQHRFGVHQRLALQAKNDPAPEILVMTATPIPRTLALTVYGDMDVSKLTERPAGRQPVDTRTLPIERIAEVIAGLERVIAGGQRAYWVSPLVAESELVDLAAAEQRYEELKSRFGGRVGLVHGRMKGADKDAAMDRFRSGDLALLVSTTVIEVGVDVPEATVMVIENAERFGLAQLHQLRGRVGRGREKSTCILLYKAPLGETAKARLSIMRETDDGFRIAEEDLRLRGAGEMLGTRQAGLPEFHMADLSVHGDLLAAARDDAALVLSRDPKLTSPRGEALRTLLHLFERSEAARLIAAG
ncbi:MAG: ATP-dependent DNA helicase RecG [Hyphomicrobiales bacterium]